MDFFEDSSVIDMAQAHVERVESLEDSELRRILELYKEVRVDLRDRLDGLSRGTFSAQQVRGTLYQVELAIKKMNDILADEMSGSAELVAGEGLKHLERELKKWDKKFMGAVTPIDIDAARIASETSNFLFNQYETSLESYGQSLRARIANGLTQAVMSDMTAGEVVTSIGRTFLGEEWKLSRIVRTELHNVYNVGKINGMKDLIEGDIPDLKKTLWHPMDHRTGKDSKILNRNNPIVPVDEPFVETSTGKKLTYMAPPNRPNDRAILIPYRDSWKK